MKMEWKKRMAYAFTACCLVASIVGCGQKKTVETSSEQSIAESLAGTYGVEVQGKVTPFIKLVKQGDNYAWTEIHADQNTAGETVVTAPFPKEQFEKATKSTVSGSYEGVSAHQAALVRLDPGATIGRLTSQSGYFVVTGLGVLPAVKQE